MFDPRFGPGPTWQERSAPSFAHDFPVPGDVGWIPGSAACRLCGATVGTYCIARALAAIVADVSEIKRRLDDMEKGVRRG